MAERLNPRLTRRSLASNLGPFATNSTDSFRDGPAGPASADTRSEVSETTNSSFRTGSDLTELVPPQPTFFPGMNNPKRHLLHNGKWVPKEFEVGRPAKRTGMWTCCGHPVHYSLYCDSLERRDLFKKMIQDEIASERDEVKAIAARKLFLEEELQRIVPVDVSDMPALVGTKDAVVAAAHSPILGFNAPMLVQWIARHNKEEVTMLEGLDYVLFHMQTGEGCVLLQRHQALDTVLKVSALYPNQTRIQQLTVQILRQLLDCNFTRDAALQASGLEVVTQAFAIGHRYMNSAAHFDPSCRVLMQCAREPRCAARILALNAPAYLVAITAKRYMRHVDVLRCVLTLCNWLAGERATMQMLFKLRIVSFASRAMRLHPVHTALLVPAIALLQRLSEHVPEAMEQMLKMEVAVKVVAALRLVYADQEVTLTALRLLQALSRTSAGFEQLNKTKNAWQLMSQGTLAGDELVHRLPGAFQNPGWALGDTPYLPELDRQKLAAKENLANSLQVTSKDWTVSSLRQFMGLSMEGKTLAINREQHEIFFDLVVTLDLLPHPGEEKEAWFARLREFEFYNDLQIEEMVLTVQEMRRRDSLNRELAKKGVRAGADADGEEFLGSVKPMYVNGEVITTQYLEDKDLSLDEALRF